MATKTIDAKTLQKVFLCGAYNLESKKELINELNVFPVPDGDTGSNMTLTIMAAAKDVAAIDSPTIENLSKTISSGSLRGARGNSGVILSQLLRGFCKEIKDKKAINVKVLADGFDRGVETAYKAVMKPKEGTILTVARGVADKALEMADMGVDIETFAKEVIEFGDEVLAGTPELLPVLKEAGVVDSGGQGLMEFLRGAYDGFLGKEIDRTIIKPTKKLNIMNTDVHIDTEHIETSEIKNGYCTEFIVQLDKKFGDAEEKSFKEYLLSIGDSLVCVSDDEICKIHVHTNHPGLAFEKGLELGSLHNMKIDNMREEHEEKMEIEKSKLEEEKPTEPEKEYGFVAVASGNGLATIFKELGVDQIISGGQTMNPSTEDVLSAIARVNAKTVFVLPNNKNIILAANQAASIEENKKVVVIPSKTIPQGIAALIAFDYMADDDNNQQYMTDALGDVKTGEVTYAVRDTSIDGKEIKIGDFMGIDDSGIKSVGTDITEVVKELIHEMTDDMSELLSIYYGEDVQEEAANELVSKLQKEFPDFEIEVHSGQQPVYYYLISLE